MIKRKIFKWSVGVGLVIASVLFLIKGSVYAGSFYSGPGAGPNATGAKCSNFQHGFVYVCPEYDDVTNELIDTVGGASWKIYPTSVNPSDVLKYHESILKEEGKDIINEILQPGKCGDYDWYVVYSWDGRLMENGVIKLNHVDYGPLNYGKTVGGRHISYNNFGAVNYGELTKMIAENSLGSGTKIDEAAAVRLFREYAEAAGLTGQTLVKNGTIGYFCAKGATEYYALSNVGANSDYDSTDIVKSSGFRKEVTLSSVSVGTDETANIRFSHNLFTSPKADNVPWQIKRSLSVRLRNGESHDGLLGFWRNEYFDTSADDEGDWRGVSNFVVPEGSYDGKQLYAAKDRGHSSGGTSYLTRDDYTFRFKQAGEYTFCEQLYVGSSTIEMTKVCVSVSVDGDSVCESESCNSTELSLCEGWENGNLAVGDFPRAGEYTASTSEYTAFGATFTRSGVRNLSAGYDWTVGNGRDFYKNPVYARPGQTIEFNHCYYPGVQKLANKVDVNVWYDLCPSDKEEVDVTLKFTPWENKFSVKSSDTMPETKFLPNKKGADATDIPGGNRSFSTGDYGIRSWGIDEYTVETGENSKAGKDLTETMTTGSPQEVNVRTASASTCCRSCECEEPPCGCCSSSSVTYHPGDSNPNPYEDIATVKVPYNYIIDNIDVSVGSDYVYAGETVKINNATFDVLPKNNEATKGFYATKVDGGEAALISFVTDDDMSGNYSVVPTDVEGYRGDLCAAISVNKDECAEIDHEYNSQFNYPEDTDGKTESWFKNGYYNVFDVSAGKYYCVVAAVYPANSGEDTSMWGQPGNAGNDMWRFSAPSCVKVAKKPSIEVWGNSVFTNGPIVTSSSNKRVVAGFHELSDSYSHDYTADDDVNLTVFGSWAEQSIVTPFALVSGFASGASTANYTSNPGLFHDRSDVEPLGGSHEGGEYFCKYRIPLTIPNVSCGSGVGGNSTVEKDYVEDKETLISQFSQENSRDAGVEFEYFNTYTKMSDFVNGILNGSTVIPAGKTYVIASTDDTDKTIKHNFRIDTNITYFDDKYTVLTDIPKLIIYASGDITIDCNVTRVDAVLIAGGDINTCPDIYPLDGLVYDDYDSGLATKQLKIFGTVITDTLTANRIYGAASGENSGVPAEIIDYDTSLYLWGSPRANVGASGKTNITYQVELPPRY